MTGLYEQMKAAMDQVKNAAHTQTEGVDELFEEVLEASPQTYEELRQIKRRELNS